MRNSLLQYCAFDNENGDCRGKVVCHGTSIELLPLNPIFDAFVQGRRVSTEFLFM